jgi:5-methylthioribose kinase
MPLDIESHPQLIAYLRAAGHVQRDEVPLCKTLQGGVSNKTVWVQRASSVGTTNGGEAWVLKQALSKLRVQVDWFSDPARVHREALGMTWLAEFAPPGATLPLVFEDFTHHLIAMPAVPQPHENWKALLLRGELDLNHIEQFGQLLGQVHALSHRHSDRVASIFDDRSFFETLRLEPYYSFTALQIPEAAPFLHKLIADTRATRLALVHADYSPKNILVHQDKLILLDHEVIHWGDPAFDVGFSMTHLLSKAHHLLPHRAAFLQAARHYWLVYQSALGLVGWAAALEERAVRHTLACLLARVAGRSPLEYLNASERAVQKRIAIALTRPKLKSMLGLIGLFETTLEIAT